MFFFCLFLTEKLDIFNIRVYLLLENAWSVTATGTKDKLTPISKDFLVFVSIQAEPLVIDLKDLFQVIFNLRKKEAEGTQKVMEAQAFNFRLEKIFSKSQSMAAFSLWKEKDFHVVLWECWQGTHCMYLLKVNTASLCSFSESHPQPFFILVMHASFQWKVCSLTVCLCLQVENGSDVVEVSNWNFFFFFFFSLKQLLIFIFLLSASRMEMPCYLWTMK